MDYNLKLAERHAEERAAWHMMDSLEKTATDAQSALDRLDGMDTLPCPRREALLEEAYQALELAAANLRLITEADE